MIQMCAESLYYPSEKNPELSDFDVFSFTFHRKEYLSIFKQIETKLKEAKPQSHYF